MKNSCWELRRDVIKQPTTPFKLIYNRFYRLSIDEIFEKLEASPIDNIKEEAEDPDHIIQKFLILDQIPQLMIAVGRWITRANISPHFVRFLAHLILFLRQIGHSHNDEIGDKVLET